MRHRKKVVRTGRSGAHRSAMLAQMVSSLIDCRRIRTTLTKARLAGSLAERMVSLGKKGGLSGRRSVLSILGKDHVVEKFFKDIVPQFSGRTSGYTRIIKTGQRSGDGSEMALLEWIGLTVPDRKKKKKPEQQAAGQKK